ncbi:MAG: phospho-sugar mutase [Bacilli bacterium]|nr:phospho-sugar mutase [Bacilli bacterium]
MGKKENYERWLNSEKIDAKTKFDLIHMSQKEIDDAFFKDVEFGTAGMRGVLGPGTNRLNDFTVRRATIGFAKYLLEKYENAKEDGVVISHDNRHFSREFTLLISRILNDFGIKTYIFDTLRPTPELSFAVRYTKACGGIMVTASHNPKEYNGYKVYDETGCQLVPDKIARLVEIINSLPNELEVDYQPIEDRGQEIVLGNEVDEEYVKEVEAIAINRDLDKSNYKIVFTPNHGASLMVAKKVFDDLGYDVHLVESQCDPDPDFSGTLSPNPEDQRSYIEPIKLAEQIHAQLVVMTDPDGDRVGLAYLHSDGTYHTFTGNQSAAMLIDYIFSERKKRGELSSNGVMFNTVVTSSLGKKISESYGIKCEQFLTGFKFIGNRIDYYEKHGGPKFEFGYEESYGCLIAPFARDKDGTQAILMYCEMALFYHLQGKTLDQVWSDLGARFGYHEDVCFSIGFKGSEGQAKMDELMNGLHNSPMQSLDNVPVVRVDDFLKRETLENGEVRPIDLPKSNVVKLYFSNGVTIAIRPSGTEPKVKFYIGVVANSEKEAASMPKKIYESFKKAVGIE